MTKRDSIAYTTAELEKFRDAVIEECAAKADYWGKGKWRVKDEPGRKRYSLHDLQTYTNITGRGIAEDIRSLKSKGKNDDTD